MAINETKPCAICKNPGTRRAIEKLPGNGILWRVEHEGGAKCEWGEYDSLEDIAKASERQTNAPEMVCPRCNHNGIISASRSDKINKPDTYRYYIKHPDDPNPKFASRQCPITTQEDRDNVLKVLGRYIDQGQVASSKFSSDKQILCIVCGSNTTAQWYRTAGGDYRCHKCYQKEYADKRRLKKQQQEKPLAIEVFNVTIDRGVRIRLPKRIQKILRERKLKHVKVLILPDDKKY